LTKVFDRRAYAKLPGACTDETNRPDIRVNVGPLQMNQGPFGISGKPDRGSNRLFHVLQLAKGKIAENARGKYQADSGGKQGGSPTDKPSIRRLLFFAVLTFLGVLLCGFRSGYHLYEERRRAASLWLSAGLLWG
jgi:hypothetical protein